MFSVSLRVVSILCSALLMSAVSPQLTYLVPQQRNEDGSFDMVESVPYDAFEYQQFLPSEDYALAAVESSELSILDYILSPITAVIGLGSTALSVVSWVVIKGGLILLGMAIVIGFCALTSYCTLTIEKPSFLARENLSAFPYLEDLEDYFTEAYNKYQEMQNSV